MAMGDNLKYRVHSKLHVLHTPVIEAILTTAKEKCLNRRVSVGV